MCWVWRCFPSVVFCVFSFVILVAKTSSKRERETREGSGVGSVVSRRLARRKNTEGRKGRRRGGAVSCPRWQCFSGRGGFEGAPHR